MHVRLRPLKCLCATLLNPVLFGLLVALSFAKRGANLYIAGRNADAASKLLAKAKSLCLETWPGYTDQVLQFFAWDASLISDNKRFANEMRLLFEEKGGLDFLVMTQGGIGNGQRKETADGHEWYANSILSKS